MFRKGPPKHPKLNPVGISSKDYFANEPMSAPAQPNMSTQRSSSKSTKLARKLSALSPPISQTASPQSLTPQSAAASAFPAAAHECFSDSDMDRIMSSPPATASQFRHPRFHQPIHDLSEKEGSSPAGSTVSHPRRQRPSRLNLSQDAPASAVNPKTPPVSENDNSEKESGGDRKRRGSLWRTKLSFTNVRRPETRRQRHQSFDSNAVDIAAHPRLYSESPLVSLPVAAPATAHGRSTESSNQLLADALVEAGIDISGPRSAAAGSLAYSGFGSALDASADDMSSLSAIDKDFLLTIQRNSALEARRQRRRETRRSTLSFLASADGHRGTSFPTGPPPAIPAQQPTVSKHENPRNGTSCSQSHAGEQRSAPAQDHHQPASQTADSASATDECQTTVSEPSVTAGDCSNDATVTSPKKPRPTSADSLTFADAQAPSSSRSARSSMDELRPGASASPQRVALSQISEAVVKESISRAALALSATEPNSALNIGHSGTTLPVSTAVAAAADTCVPPVPPLPQHIVSQSRKPVSLDPPHPLGSARPGTARAHNSPRMVPDSRKYRGSTSVMPSTLHLEDRAPPSSLDMALLMSASSKNHSLQAEDTYAVDSIDAQAAKLQRYCIASTTADLSSAPTSDDTSALGLEKPSAETTQDYGMTFARKFSHPDAELHSSILPLDTSSTLLSKSATNLHIRMSMDSRTTFKDASASVTNSKHGLNRIFSPVIPSRKNPHADSTPPPTSPTVASLVGDPLARRKIRDQLASSKAFDRLLEEDDEFTMAISLTPTVAGHK
ncbi:hypothetical protein IWW36_002495 [Coemansia brasiliensis]|uniref:Uncharacterized protein n=1 Tax=Coemansia brasiliensis TaxID=2650707 RepID=A0A9W8M0Z5_9FUNG|nr:hypothetical protein IWW36_002495 [Coemansia brasiliensis]